jgi:hypothetical protein
MPRQQRTNRIQRARSEASFRRREPVLAPRTILLIVCEGAATEHHYFEAWRTGARLTTVTIEVQQGAGQAGSVVNAAIGLRDRRQSAYKRAARRGQSADPPFDEVWCVFDREGQHEVAAFWSAVERADREQIELAVSNPCFEYWYLLHFRDSDAPFHHGQELKQTLRRYIDAYEAGADPSGQLLPLTATALERARRWYERHAAQGGDRFPNPSTTVYRLVERFHTTVSG